MFRVYIFFPRILPDIGSRADRFKVTGRDSGDALTVSLLNKLGQESCDCIGESHGNGVESGDKPTT